MLSKLVKQLKRNISYEQLEIVAKVLKAISHPVRLEILEILEVEEPLSVSSIRERLSSEVEQSMLSHHLIKLKDKGVLCSTKEGKNILYRIQDRQILKIFDCMEKCSFI